MSKDFSPEELGGRAFFITIAGVILYAAAVILFVL